MSQQKNIQVSIKLSEEDNRKLIEYCEENDLKKAFVIRVALREYLKNHQN